MSVRVVSANCVDAMANMDGASVDMILTSPPYDDLRCYNGYAFDAQAVGEGMYWVLNEGGVAVWVVGDKRAGGCSLTSFRQAVLFQEMGFTMHDVMIYQKLNTPFPRGRAYTPAHEFMFVLVKGDSPKTFNALAEATTRTGRESAIYHRGADGDNSKRRRIVRTETKTRTNVWPYAVGLNATTKDREAFNHPAMFPEALARDHILSWSNEGDTVLDPMCGAGTTLKVAHLLGRNAIGIEISNEYAELARRRCEGDLLC